MISHSKRESLLFTAFLYLLSTIFYFYLRHIFQLKSFTLIFQLLYSLLVLMFNTLLSRLSLNHQCDNKRINHLFIVKAYIFSLQNIPYFLSIGCTSIHIDENQWRYQFSYIFLYFILWMTPLRTCVVCKTYTYTWYISIYYNTRCIHIQLSYLMDLRSCPFTQIISHVTPNLTIMWLSVVWWYMYIWGWLRSVISKCEYELPVITASR